MPNGEFKLIIALMLLLLVALCDQSAGIDLGQAEYRCPLFGPFAVLRDDLRFPPGSSGRYQLAVALSSHFDRNIVENLKKVAVNGQAIVGTTETGYFIVDTLHPEADPQIFTEIQPWEAALKAAGIPANIQLNDPDALAATKTDRQLHPFKYRMMKGMLGLSDEDWGGIVTLTSLAAIFARGLLTRPNASLFPLALLLAWLVTGALMVLRVLDTGAFLGFIVYPGLYWLVGKFGRFFRRFIWDAAMRRRAQRPMSPI